MSEDIRVIRNSEARQYEARVDGRLSIAEYVQGDGEITFTHTVVPDEVGHRGVASQLAQVALEDARRDGVRVIPQCVFFRDYIQRNPQYKDLLAGP